MPIAIERMPDGRYAAWLSPAHGGGTEREAFGPLAQEALIQALRARGCHQTDIGDAFYDADPEWLFRAQTGE
jgi:hypothetical protein